jgi:uncharacterized Rossmann fold enzyme
VSVIIADTNVSVEKRAENVRLALKRDARHFKPCPAHERICILVGGGPSVQDELFTISALTGQGEVFAVNNVPRYLAERGLDTDVHVLMDADPIVETFVVHQLRSIRYYASQCEPAVLDKAGNELILWHAASMALDGVPGITHIVGGGSTTATRAIFLAYGLGYRNFHLFGLDSSYEGEKCHAYKQAGYDIILDVHCGDKTFRSSPQMIAQAEDFKVIIPDMLKSDCSVTVHGSGLLRAIADQFLTSHRSSN